MGRVASLFGNIKHCEFCGKALPDDYLRNYCPTCLDSMLFNEVKDYIRSNNVNEYEVADHFQIPVFKVKSWIRDGRIEYKSSDKQEFTGMHCQRCGAQITLGALCPKCLKEIKNSSKKGFSMENSIRDDSRMRFFDPDDSSF